MATLLRDLAETTVDLRVTLAYMIEPNPGRRGMLGRYSYASHGLRFAIKGPTESGEAFQRRLAEQAEHDSGIGNPKAYESNSRWLVGPRFRNLGSLHADTGVDQRPNSPTAARSRSTRSAAGGRPTSAKTALVSPSATPS